MKIYEEIKKYKPYNEQEERDKIEILKHLSNNKEIFSRENKAAHMTASAWVVNEKRNKILMVHHNIYNSWSWLGGHADGEKDLYSVAFKEVLEESGISEIHPISMDIFSLEILTVDGHEKNGEYVSCHLHLNTTYLFEADEESNLIIKPDENSGVKWFGLDEGVKASSERWFRERIYSKLNKKLGEFKYPK